MRFIYWLIVLFSFEIFAANPNEPRLKNLKFQSSIILHLANVNAPQFKDEGDFDNHFKNWKNALADYQTLIKSDQFLETLLEAEKVNPKKEIKELRSWIKSQQIKDTDLLEITVTSDNPNTSKTTAVQIAEYLIESAKTDKIANGKFSWIMVHEAKKGRRVPSRKLQSPPEP